MKKVLIPVLLTFGLFSGSASALVITLDPGNQEILTIGDGVISSGDREVDNFSQFATTSAGGADIAVDQWVGLDVIVGSTISTITSEDQASPGGITTNLDLALYEATAVGNDWTVGALVDTALPSPLVAGLSLGKYLVNFSGDLPAGLVALDHLYGVRVSTVVPVPAAMWLFGTAVIGLIGLRRKSKMVAAA